MNATAQKRSAPSTRATLDPGAPDEAPARDPIEVLLGRMVALLGIGPTPKSASQPEPSTCPVDATSPQHPPSNDLPQGEQAPRLAEISARLWHDAKTAQRVVRESPATLRTLGAALGRLAARARDSLRQALAPRSVPERPTETNCITLPVGVTLAQAERELIRCTFAACQRSRKLTAEKLGISRRSLYYKLREHEIPLS